jgi:protein ImuB
MNASPRTGCVWCPDWPVVAARRRDPDLRGVPVVVRERVGSRVLVRAASSEARADGVTRGMRWREAEARCPGVAGADRDESLEARAFEVVARAVETLTPRVVLERPGLCAFLTRGPARYFGGDAALATTVRDAVAAVLGDDDDVRIGIADGAFTARLAARRATKGGVAHVVDPGASAAFLAPWPVWVLGDDELANLLVRLGLHTLGDVAALPPDAVLARFGAEGRQFHDLARGLDPGPPVLVTPPPDLVEQVELDPPAARVDIAAFAAKGLADRLLERLAERGLACTRVVVEAETEHGERLARCWRHAGALTPAALAERVRWQLDGWLAAATMSSVVGDPGPDAGGAGGIDDAVDDTTGGLTLLRLVPDEVVPADGRQLGFWGGDQVAHDRADRALARVQGMLGFDAVVTAVVQGGRTPAEQIRWVPWGEPREPARALAVGTEITPWPGALPSPFPARILDPPVPAQLCDANARPVVVTGRGEQPAPPARVRCAVLPGGGGAVRAWAGPWAHDVRWWDPGSGERRARWQLVVECGDAGEVACVVALAAGRFAVEAVYD